jgi:hypothetical protein
VGSLFAERFSELVAGAMRAEAGAVFMYDVSLMQPSQLCNAESALKESQPQMYVMTCIG